MDTRVDRELGVEDAAPDAELFEKKFQPVAPVDVLNKDDAFALDKLQLEDDIREKELLVLAASERGASATAFSHGAAWWGNSLDNILLQLSPFRIRLI